MRLRTYAITLFLLASALKALGQNYTISTFAGGGLPPTNILGTSACLVPIFGIAVDTAGDVFFTDETYSIVQRLDAKTGVLTTVAGNGTQGFSGDGGPATSAEMYSVNSVAVDSAGNLYIADTDNYRIREVSNGVITTVAGNGTAGFSGDGGQAASAQLNKVDGVAVDSTGNLYIADTLNNVVRKVSNGVITTVAGNGTAGFGGDTGQATSAELNGPTGIAVDSTGNLYIADAGNNRIRKVSNGVITTVTGNGTAGYSGIPGPATSAELKPANGVAVDSSGNLYIADTDNFRIVKVSNGTATDVAGNGTTGFSGDGGPATSAQLASPWGVAIDSAGNLYIADHGNYRIRKVSNGAITTIAGGGSPGDNGPATSAQLLVPEGVATDSAGNLYITDWQNDRIRKVSNGMITTVAGNGIFGFSGDGGPAISAELGGPGGAVALDSAGNLYIPDEERVRKVSNGVITTVAGGGTSLGDNIPATSAELYPSSVAVDSAGNLYVSDFIRNIVRKVSNGVITTVAGNGNTSNGGDGGPATRASLADPGSLAVDSAGNLYITTINSVREVSNGIITTVAGGGSSTGIGDNGPATSAKLDPSGIAFDSAGNLYIADAGHERVRKVSNGVITTIAGNGTAGFSGDGGPATNAEFSSPVGVAVDSAGNVYIGDADNNRIRLLTPGSVVAAVNPSGIVPIDSAVSVVQSGSWVSIYGSNLASGTYIWNGDFPTTLGGVSVTIDGNPAYLWYVSPTLINLQVPNDTTTGPVTVVVTTPFGPAISKVTLAPQGPSFLLQGDGKHVLAIVVTPGSPGNSGAGYDVIGPSRPVNPGETMLLFGVGFGPTTPPVPAGQAFSGAAPTNSPVTITMGGVQGSVLFAGLTEAGLYQFNVTAPANAPSGDQPLQASVNAVQTPSGPVLTVE